MDEPAWWPTGIALSSLEVAQKDGLLRTSYGRTVLWNFETFLAPEGWDTTPEDGTVWGEWKTEIKTIELLSTSSRGLTLLLNQELIATIQPAHIGDDVSRLARYEPWQEALKDHNLLLPTGGWAVDGNDRILIYPLHSTVAFEGKESTVLELVKHFGALHTSLEPFTTPNTERRWNDRLKAVEDQLKTNTMWRAPHAASTFGLPRIHLSFDSIVEVDGEQMFLPLCRYIE